MVCAVLSKSALRPTAGLERESLNGIPVVLRAAQTPLSPRAGGHRTGGVGPPLRPRAVIKGVVGPPGALECQVEDRRGHTRPAGGDDRLGGVRPRARSALTGFIVPSRRNRVL